MGNLNRTDFTDHTIAVPVVIANGAAISAAIDLGGCTLVGIHMPAAWTTANLTFSASEDSVAAYDSIYDASGTEKTVTAAASRFIHLTASDWIGFKNIKIRSGNAGSPVNQGAARTIVLLLRPNLG